MEILITIPPWVVTAVNDAYLQLQSCGGFVSNGISTIGSFLAYGRNSLWVLFSMIVFWPIWVYFAIAVTTASTWIFWLLASIFLGIVQVIYVTYQFFMVSLNVMILTLLKTYQVIMRSRFITFLFFFSRRVRRSRLRKSRRRTWKKLCEKQKSYDGFQTIQVLEPTVVPKKEQKQEQDKKDQAEQKDQFNPLSFDSTTCTNKELVLPSSPQRTSRANDNPGTPKRYSRSASFASLTTLHEENNPTTNNNSTSGKASSPDSTLRRSMTRVISEGKLNRLLGEDGQDQAEPTNDIGDMTTDLLTSTMSRLHEARRMYMKEGDQSLQYLLSGVVKRNHLTIEDHLVKNSRSVAESGQYGISKESRDLIADYYDEVSRGIESVAKADVSEYNDADPFVELSDRMTLVRKMKQNMGRTALMLSGGGAQAMYHLGTVRALIDGGLYDDIKVISGTSGGSITAAMCALRTSKELYEDVCVSSVSTDYKLTGEMKKQNIRWFPPVVDMLTYWLKHRLLVDSSEFRRTCEFYYSDTTFAEAFERTGKHVCITVSASRATGDTAQRLLLNHISTPHVTLASAVAASCALPGVMKPAKLETKNSNGDLEPFEVDGVEWIDGSVQADLPFQRISTLFNVSNYIVAQTNFHVLPFLNKAHHPNTRSLYWRLFQTVEWDIRNRALKLSRLGLFPRLFGQDISKVFKQKYHGNLTLVPRFTAMQTFGLQALVNPTKKDMEGYLKYGQIAAWPFLSVIKDMVRLETALDECLAHLTERCRRLNGEFEISLDDLDSIASSTSNLNTQGISSHVVRAAGGRDREVKRLRLKLTKAEQQNLVLRQQVEQLQALLAKQSGGSSTTTIIPKLHNEGEMKQQDEKNNDDDNDGQRLPLSEGSVWNLIRQGNSNNVSSPTKQ